MARGTAEDKFAQAAVAVGAHDQEAGIDLSGMPEQRLAGAFTVAFDRLWYSVHLVALEHRHDSPARLFGGYTILSLGIDTDDIDGFRRLQQRKRIVYRACGLTPAVPADNDAVEVEDVVVAARQDQ